VNADCSIPAGYTPLAQCLDSNRNAVVGAAGCANAFYEGSALIGADALGSITIQAGAKLTLGTSAAFLDTAGIDVSGTLQIGTADCPVTSANQVKIRFLGSKPAKCDKNANPLDKDCHLKGIYVESGGTLLLRGEKGVGPSGVPWTMLAEPAGPPAEYGTVSGTLAPAASAERLTLSEDVSQDWQAGDWIVVATTDFVSYNSEFVQIQKPSPSTSAVGGSIVPLNPTTTLVNYHFGSPAPNADSYKDGADTNFGIDERAEIGLISRNIKLTAVIPTVDEDPDGASLHWGGEIHIKQGFNKVEIQGVEIEKFGKDQLGSYPIHFHMVGTPSNPPLVDSNSIHHSYNKCIVLHQSNGITLSNNVCARIVGHIFYLEDGTEANNTFEHNLGLGAMQHNFPQFISASWDPASNSCKPNGGVTPPEGGKGPPWPLPPTPSVVNQYFWSGDYLANPTLYAGSAGGRRASGSVPIAYDGFNIPNWDTRTNDVHGVCYNSWGVAQACESGKAFPLYFEPPSGFWLTNPTTNLIGNSIGGCQGSGRGIWYLPTAKNFNQPIGTFKDNYVHACDNGLDTAADVGINSQNLAPHDALQRDVITTFAEFTATRNRFKAVWVRPNWYHIDNARLATNFESISLVSSGGTEGSAPGVWSMLSNSVLAGMSTNNPGRFGPCPSPNGAGCLCEAPNVFNGQAYPQPTRNFQGYMFYDGPARIVGNRFVNFNVDITPVLTTADKDFLDAFSGSNRLPFDPTEQFVYEGDAAFGWIQSNLQSVPPTQYTQGLIFENTDLRHQVYTESVNFGAFDDGDKNTVILDKDGTLTGYKVVGPNKEPRRHKFPVSLNNLAFLGSDDAASTAFPGNPSTVDECLSTGAQDEIAENRASSLISPFDYAVLETSVLTCTQPKSPTAAPPDDGKPAPPDDGERFPYTSGTGPCNNLDKITFVKDQVDYGMHQSMTLSGRNGNGIYEPKVVDGWGYTLQKSPNGFPNFFSLGFTDANTEDLKTNPFNVRVGICLQTETGTFPTADECVNNPTGCKANFTIQRGYKSYGGPTGNQTTLTEYWNNLAQCQNLDNQTFMPFALNDPENPALYRSNIPTNTVFQGQEIKIAGCPSPGYPAETHPIESLVQTDDIDKVDATHYYYDDQQGMLFFEVTQERPNALGPSPLGSCEAGSPEPCPQVVSEGETFYSCPPEGCRLYTVTINSPDYVPQGATNCAPYGGTGPDDGTGGYTQTYPSGTDRLAYVVPADETPSDPIYDGEIARNIAVPQNEIRSTNYPHNQPEPMGRPLCSENRMTDPTF